MLWKLLLHCFQEVIYVSVMLQLRIEAMFVHAKMKNKSTINFKLLKEAPQTVAFHNMKCNILSEICNIFRQNGGGVKGRLELLQKFICFAGGGFPLISNFYFLKPLLFYYW